MKKILSMRLLGVMAIAAIALSNVILAACSEEEDISELEFCTRAVGIVGHQAENIIMYTLNGDFLCKNASETHSEQCNIQTTVWRHKGSENLYLINKDIYVAPISIDPSYVSIFCANFDSVTNKTNVTVTIDGGTYNDPLSATKVVTLVKK